VRPAKGYGCFDSQFEECSPRWAYLSEHPGFSKPFMKDLSGGQEPVPWGIITA
jgi:hypothetical protein